jgi:hypothetical protein
MPSPDREITSREVLLLAAGACLLSVIMNWPLVFHLGTDVPKDLGDPLVQAWQVAWDGHALAHQPLDFFQSNQFWPLDDTLAFSDALIGYAPAGLLGSGAKAAYVRYDVLFLFAYALAFAGAYLLARELGIGPAGAAVAGAAFAFAPFRLEQDGHMHVISSGGIPLALALGLRGYRLRRAGVVFAGWAVATWQLSLGFTLGVPLAYLIATLGLIAALVWLRRGRPGLDRRLVVATAVGAVTFVAVGALIGRTYMRVVDNFPEAKRPPGLVEDFSGPAWSFLVVPDENLVWGDATASLREELENVPEQTLFPGVIIVALAIAGLWWPGYPRGLRVGLAAGVVIVSVLALGFKVEDGFLYPYRAVYELLPGWTAIRVPGRIVTFSSLGLALLAAAGTEWMIRASAARRRAGWGPFAVAGLLVLAILVEGRGLPFDPLDDRAQPRAPQPPADISSIPAPQFHLPAERPEDNRRYLLWSTDGFPEIVNGRSSLNPDYTARLIARVRDFPDSRSVALLRRLGVRSVVLHVTRTPGTPWRGTAKGPLSGLDLSRRRLGDVIVYEIGSPSGGSETESRSSASSRRRSR